MINLSKQHSVQLAVFEMRGLSSSEISKQCQGLSSAVKQCLLKQSDWLRMALLVFIGTDR